MLLGNYVSICYVISLDEQFNILFALQCCPNILYIYLLSKRVLQANSRDLGKTDTKQKPPETSFPFIYVLGATKRSKFSHSKIIALNSEKYLVPFVFKTQ